MLARLTLAGEVKGLTVAVFEDAHALAEEVSADPSAEEEEPEPGSIRVDVAFCRFRASCSDRSDSSCPNYSADRTHYIRQHGHGRTA